MDDSRGGYRAPRIEPGTGGHDSRLSADVAAGLALAGVILFGVALMALGLIVG